MLMPHYLLLYLYFLFLMQKELRAFDAELASNAFIRVQDTSNKSQNSLFRALAMAIYFNHQQSIQLKQELRLTLINNLGERKNSCYPLLNDTTLLKKYYNNQELILNYWEHQDLECFLNDNLNLASAAFDRTICILTLDKEGYLCQSFITACKHQNKNYIYLAKVNKKFYCVFQMTTYAHLLYIKEKIIDELVNSVVLGNEGKKYPKQEKVIIHHYDDVHHRRQHKKSLSDCDDVPVQIQSQQRKKQLEESSDRGCNPNNIRLFDTTQIVVVKPQDDYFDFNSHSRESFKSVEENNRVYVQPYNYYSYPYNYYNQHEAQYLNQQQYVTAQQQFGYIQATGPINNQRYTGRLKFFDQNGNYGFIVIDNLNIDIFVHYDDLSKAGLTKQKLNSLKNHYQLRFEFTYYEYEGKQHKKSKKAIDLTMLSE